MAAYVIAEIEVTDPTTYAEYGRQVLATIEKFGGRFVVRGGAVEPLEGGWTPKRLVVLEFPTMAKAREWADTVCLNGPLAGWPNLGTRARAETRRPRAQATGCTGSAPAPRVHSPRLLAT